MRALAVIAVAAVLGCGGARSGSTTSPPGPDDSAGAGDPDAAHAAHAESLDGGAPELLGEDDCARMADHMIDVQLAERERLGQEIPDPGQLDEIRLGIKAEFVPQCAGVFERATYECWMGASSHAEFERCAGGPAAPPE